MTDFRPASIFADDIETLESAGEALFRHHENSDAIRLLAIALRLRGQTGFYKAQVFAAELAPGDGGASSGDTGAQRGRARVAGADQSEDVNVVWSMTGKPFACSAADIDESGGLADVVELNGYSRRTPCS